MSAKWYLFRLSLNELIFGTKELIPHISYGIVSVNPSTNRTWYHHEMGERFPYYWPFVKGIYQLHFQLTKEAFLSHRLKTGPVFIIQ